PGAACARPAKLFDRERRPGWRRLRSAARRGELQIQLASRRLRREVGCWNSGKPYGWVPAPVPGASAKAKLRGKLRMMNHRLVFNIFLVVAFTGVAFAQSDWNEPFPPHRIADNLYYVGSKGLSTYLITTD